MRSLLGRVAAAVVVLAAASGGVGLVSMRAAVAAPATTVIVSEVAPWGSSTPGYGADWFELTNTGSIAVNISGWKMDDNSYSFAASVALGGVTTIAAGESVIFVEGTATTATTFKTAWFGASGVPPQVGFYSGSGVGLSTGGDAVTIFNGSGVIQTAVSFGANAFVALPGVNRSFDNAAGLGSTTASAGSPPVALTTFSAAGTNGAFQAPDATSTQIGSPGTITGSGSGTTTTTASTTTAAPTTTLAGPTYLSWPGSQNVSTVDLASTFSSNLSGLDYEHPASGPDVLWGVVNGPGTLYRLMFDGTNWVPDTTNNWGAGKALRYTDGTGDPDSEGVTMIGDSSTAGIFVSTERNNTASGTSRKSILRFDPTAAGSTLTATNEWNLTNDVPAVPGDANLGLEAITWIDDAFLVGNNFYDDALGHLYNPADYPNHGTGLFFTGVESTGIVYVYALDLTPGSGGFQRVTSFSAGFAQNTVMDLQFDRDLQELWAACDNTCAGRMHLLRLDPGTGHFSVALRYERPTAMPNTNNEGFAIAPASSCIDGQKPVFWSDDNDINFFSLRTGTLPCAAALPPALVSEFPNVVLPIGVVMAAIGVWLAASRRRRLTLA